MTQSQRTELLKDHILVCVRFVPGTLRDTVIAIPKSAVNWFDSSKGKLIDGGIWDYVRDLYLVSHA